jgi:hypothetical protein
MWTGFEMQEVMRRYTKVFQLLDIIITGPYVAERRVRGIPFITSNNQRIYCLTARARKDLIKFNNVSQPEIVISKNTSSAVCFGINLSGV